MTRLLIVDSDSKMRQALEEAVLADSAISFAPDGFYTLTLLERDPPDLIVVRSQLQDMSGWELCSIIKRDSAFSEVKIVLLAEHSTPPPGDRKGAMFDEVIVDSTGSFLLDHAESLGSITFEKLIELSRKSPILERSPDTGPVTLPVAGLETVPKSALKARTLPDLLRALVAERETGSLTVKTLFGQGLIIFENGQIIHSILEKLTGRTALAAACYGAGKIQASSFEFERLTHEQMKWPRTIEVPAEELLLGLRRDLEKNNTLELDLPLRPEELSIKESEG